MWLHVKRFSYLLVVEISFLWQCRYLVCLLWKASPQTLSYSQRRPLISVWFKDVMMCLIAVQDLLNQSVDRMFTMTPSSKPDTSAQHNHVQEYAREVLSMGYYWWSLLTQSKREMGWESSVVGGCSSQFLRQQLDELFHRGVHPACSTWFCFYAEDETTVDVEKNIPCDLYMYMEHLNCECVFINNNNIVTDKFCNIQHNCMIGYKVTTLALLTGGCSSASKSCNRNLFYNCPSGCNNHASVVWHLSPLCHWLHSKRELSLHSHPFLPFLSLAGNAPTSSGGAQWMILQILGQLKPIPNAMVAMIIWRWLEGSLEGTYDWILYFWIGACSKHVHDVKTSQI